MWRETRKFMCCRQFPWSNVIILRGLSKTLKLKNGLLPFLEWDVINDPCDADFEEANNSY